MTAQLRASRRQARQYGRQAELAVALQRSMLTELPDLAPLQLAARYLPATEAAEIGGDWYDAFILPGGAVKLTVGDLAGHDVDAAGAMGQARSVLRALAVDRREPPGRLLDRFDTVLAQLLPARTGTCVCAQVSADDAGWHALLGNAGHPPPLLITDQGARYLELPTSSCSAPAWRSSGPAPR
jgi:serine phosphatase RsbU (regulator of sigma subunit)